MRSVMAAFFISIFFLNPTLLRGNAFFARIQSNANFSLVSR